MTVSHIGEESGRPDVIFVVGGTRKLFALVWYKLFSVPIVYRLDGILWIHRRNWPGLRRFAVCEFRNFLCKFIHAYLADHVVYQSQFVCDWWRQSGWRQNRPYSIIYNGVDIDDFSPNKECLVKSTGREVVDVISVEGHIDYSPYAINLLNELAAGLAQYGISILLYGDFANKSSVVRLSTSIDYKGVVPRDEVKNIFRAGIYLSLDVHAACPNTVIEALSSGIPVVGLDTGSLSELVPSNCGRVVKYTGDSWKLESPSSEPLKSAILEVLQNYSELSRNARLHAEKKFDIEMVTNSYFEVFDNVTR